MGEADKAGKEIEVVQADLRTESKEAERERREISSLCIRSRHETFLSGSCYS